MIAAARSVQREVADPSGRGASKDSVLSWVHRFGAASVKPYQCDGVFGGGFGLASGANRHNGAVGGDDAKTAAPTEFGRVAAHSEVARDGNPIVHKTSVLPRSESKIDSHNRTVGMLTALPRP